MPEFIYQLSSVSLFMFLIITLLTTSIIAISLVSRYIVLDFRYQENTAIVSCSALLGIIYAVLIGFIILFQLSSFDKAERSEELEGNTLHSIYHDVALLPQPTGSKLQSLVLAYTNNAIQYEWPALASGHVIDSKGRRIIESMIHETQIISPSHLTGNTITVLNRIEQEISLLFQAHHERTAVVHTTLNGHIWFVLILGTIVTLGMNYFLGMELRLHIFCISLIAVVMSALIYLVVGLDRPYQGDFTVRPDTIESILEEGH